MIYTLDSLRYSSRCLSLASFHLDRLEFLELRLLRFGFMFSRHTAATSRPPKLPAKPLHPAAAATTTPLKPLKSVAAAMAQATPPAALPDTSAALLNAAILLV